MTLRLLTNEEKDQIHESWVRVVDEDVFGKDGYKYAEKNLSYATFGRPFSEWLIREKLLFMMEEEAQGEERNGDDPRFIDSFMYRGSECRQWYRDWARAYRYVALSDTKCIEHGITDELMMNPDKVGEVGGYQGDLSTFLNAVTTILRVEVTSLPREKWGEKLKKMKKRVFAVVMKEGEFPSWYE